MYSFVWDFLSWLSTDNTANKKKLIAINYDQFIPGL